MRRNAKKSFLPDSLNVVVPSSANNLDDDELSELPPATKNPQPFSLPVLIDMSSLRPASDEIPDLPDMLAMDPDSDEFFTPGEFHPTGDYVSEFESELRDIVSDPQFLTSSRMIWVQNSQG